MLLVIVSVACAPTAGKYRTRAAGLLRLLHRQTVIQALNCGDKRRVTITSIDMTVKTCDVDR